MHSGIGYHHDDSKLSDDFQQALVQYDGGPIEVEGAGVLMTLDVYRSLVGDLPDDDQDFDECVEGIREGLASMQRGEGVPLDEAFKTILND